MPDKNFLKSTIHQLFIKQVRNTPDAIALIFQDQRLTYRELDERSNQLAHYLRTRYHTEHSQELPTETLVALLLERSVEMVVAILAIFKAGAAYVPIDPNYPDERISYILKDTKTPLICCQAKYQNTLTRILEHNRLFVPSSGSIYNACVLVDEIDWREEPLLPLPDRLNSENLAYIIYTSGTTGKPKGVMIEHKALINRITWMQETYPLTSHDKVLQKTPYTFDVSVWELLWANLYGACIVMAPPESHKYPEELEQLIKTHEVTALHFVPTMLQSFLDYLAAAQKSLADQLRYVFCSGEALALKTVNQFYNSLKAHSQTQLHNLYGPTETAIDSTFFACSKLNATHNSVPIGRPIANTKLYILDNTHCQVADGNIGELFIAGTGLARGYLNRPELTQDRFIPNPYVTCGYERLYKTGDLVRRLADGNIEYLGRNDSQIKIRGFRIELGEIENTITQFSSIKLCVVVVGEHTGQKHLIAYFTAEQTIDYKNLRHWLDKKLPEYMIPGLFMQVETFPVTHNGKLDRSALPEVNFKSLHSQYRVAENRLQQTLCNLVAELLELPEVGIDDNFFALGGDSILTIRLAVKLRSAGYTITVRDIVSCQSVRQLAAFIECDNSKRVTQEESLDINTLSLNPMQQLIVNHQLTSHGVLYNEHITIDFNDEAIEIDILNQAITALVNHHQILRCYCDENYKCFMVGPIIGNSARKNTRKIVSFNQVPDQQAYRYELNNLLNQIFDLKQGPLYRFALFQVGKTRYKLAAIFHHIIADGDAMYNLFVPQLKILLQSLQQKETVLPQLPQFSDTIQLPPPRQDFHSLLSGMHSLNLFAGGIDVSRGVSVKNRTNTEGSFIVEYLPAQETQYLCDLARLQGVSFYSLLLSLIYLLMYKISGESNLCVGGVKSLRSSLSQPVFGNFLANEINVIEMEEDKNFIDLLQTVFANVQQSLLTTLPYTTLLKEIRKQGDPAEKLPNVFMTMEPKMAGDNRWYITQNEGLPAHVKYELYFEFDLQEQLELRIEYRHQAYTKAQIQILTRSWRQILTRLRDHLEVPLKSFSLLNEKERNALIYEYNQTERPYPLRSIQGVFSDQAKRYPNETALIAPYLPNVSPISYAQLENKANQLANYLCTIHEHEYGVSLPRGELIALCFDPSVEMIVSILAVLKAGGAYVPLDPDYPWERISYIMNDTGAKIILTGHNRVTALERIMEEHELNCRLVNVDDPSETWQNASTAPPVDEGRMDDLAYVIYTSGTTGHPKGVMVEHAAVVSLVKNNHFMSIHPLDCFMHLASPAFDAATLEIWGPLLNGARLVLPGNIKEVLANLDRFKQQMEEFGVSILWLTKTLFDTLYLSDNTLFESLDYLITGGEALDPGLIKALSTDVHGPRHLLNGYGPTETTTFATTYDCHQEFNGSVPIGRPINGRKTYILDRSLNPVAQGLVGELYVGGAGVARGYLNREQLTSERFPPNPFASETDRQNGHTQMYKTGDLVRLLDNGNIEYIGRNDSQVKIRGFRIEPGEIETLIKQYPGIAQAVVVSHDWQGHKQLVAYYTSVETIDEENLRHSLQQQLPDYMQPARLIAVPEFKLTINGKLDYRALPAPSFTADGYKPPRNEQETQVCDIVAQLLNVKQVGIDDDFFRIGGDSILSIQLTSRLRRIKIHLSVKAIFEHKTIRRMLASLEPQPETLAEQDVLTGSFDLLPVQQWFFDQSAAGLLPARHHWNQSFMLSVPPLDPQRLAEILPALMAHHDMLRTSFTRTDHPGTTDNQVHYQQNYQARMAPPTLRILNARGLSSDQVSQTLTQWQSEYDLFDASKPLFSMGYVSNYRVGNQVGNYLFFSAHHLIIDSVSWRIIAEDLQSLYNKEDLLPKSTSYRNWVTAVADYAERHRAQQDYWSQVLSPAAPVTLPKAESEFTNTRITFSTSLTQDLLYQANQAYSTEINDLLLTALAGALSDLNGCAENLITLEGHGRETIDATLDVSRTLGWFTTLFPVKLHHGTNLSLAIRQTKEMLRSIPDKGIGFGALTANSGQQAQPSPHPENLPLISFNYLGIFNSDPGREKEPKQGQQLGMEQNQEQEQNQGLTNNNWTLADVDCGESVDAANNDPNLININGLVIDGVMQFDFCTRLDREQHVDFSTNFKERLENLVNHCMQCLGKGQRRKTPSDFHAPISLELFDRLYRENISAIYGANSLQQGFIYHALSHAQDDAYRVQILIDYPHEIEVEHFKRAWEYAIATYPILRTSFNWEEMPVQLIHKTAVLDFNLHDCSDCSDLQAEINHIQTHDRQQAFDLTTPSLMRLHLIKQSEHHYTLLKSEHHSIADGWSEPVLLARVAEYYGALQRGEAISIQEDTAYLEAQEYYARHTHGAKAYWAKQQQWLGQANDLSVLLSRTADLDTIRTLTRPKSIDLSLSCEPFKKIVRDHGLTLNSMVQFAWHKLISIYTGDEQTIVGTTVSGRAIPIDGIEQSVGLYINTLPLGIDWAHEESVLTQLQHINRRIAELNTYAFTPLASLQKEGRRLFHSLLVYENYPMTPADDTSPLRGEISAAIEKVDYPLALIVHEQDEQLHMGLSYDADLIEPNRAEQIGEQFKRILAQIPGELDQTHSRITMLSQEERHTLLSVYNQTDRPYPSASLHELFRAQALATQEQINYQALPSLETIKLNSFTACTDEAVDHEKSDVEENATEKWLKLIFAKALGRISVDVSDNFFRLGINSILTISIMHQIRKKFYIELSYADFMTNSNIRALSTLINTSQSNEEIHESGEL